jgi:hypothetical protein
MKYMGPFHLLAKRRVAYHRAEQEIENKQDRS